MRPQNFNTILTPPMTKNLRNILLKQLLKAKGIAKSDTQYKQWKVQKEDLNPMPYQQILQ